RCRLSKPSTISKLYSLRSYTTNPTTTSTTPSATFSNQTLLPRLPLPTLQSTASKYLEHLRPVLKEQDLQKAESDLGEFLKENGGLGWALQEGLEKAEETAEKLWMTSNYYADGLLSDRSPLVINSNWWAMFNDHPNHPKDLLAKPPPQGVLTTFQVQRAAGLICNLLKFKALVEREKLPAEYLNASPLCMDQYRKIFTTTRIPGQEIDTLESSFPPSTRHVIVMTKGQLYKVDVLREDGTIVPMKEIERLLYAIGKDSFETEPLPQVGLLTAKSRDEWHELYTNLSASDINAESLSQIKSSLFVVCLDDGSFSKNVDFSHRQFLDGLSGSNRWFDKGLQLIVAPSGRSGLNVEASAVDPDVQLKVVEFIVSNEPASDSPYSSMSPPMPAPQKLKWELNTSLERTIHATKTQVQQLSKERESVLLKTTSIGTRYLAEIAKTDPNIFVQLALQVAWYRLYKSPIATLGQLFSHRRFTEGRSDIVNVVTDKSVDFAKCFDNDDILYDTKRDQFRKAVESLHQRFEDSLAGKNPYGHLQALKNTHLRQNGDKDIPALFDAKSVYNKFSSFQMLTMDTSSFTHSTSNLSGPAHTVSYTLTPYTLSLNISSPQPKGAYTFRHTLERTLKDMEILFPRRSEIWGKQWREMQRLERREAELLKRMKGLSELYKSRREELERKYKVGKAEEA
ncbi:hypothetical protein HDV05_005040, partial [Chytridiales sp. JEL 0842]